jgi:hypothetical protein
MTPGVSNVISIYMKMLYPYLQNWETNPNPHLDRARAAPNMKRGRWSIQTNVYRATVLLRHPASRFNRIDRILIPLRYTFFFRSSTEKNSEVKRIRPRVILGWVTDRKVFPSAHK